MKKAKTPKGASTLDIIEEEVRFEKPIPQIGYGSNVLVIDGFYMGSVGQVIGFDIYGTPKDGYTLYYNIVTDNIHPIKVEECYIKTI